MKIKLKKSQHLDDWFTIVRVEHDGKGWIEKTGPSCSRFMMSERLSPEACIEGTKDEMIELARAIKRGGSASFKRCAVHFESDGVHFRSPKNSEHDAIVSVEEAHDFADQVLATIATNEQTKNREA